MAAAAATETDRAIRAAETVPHGAWLSVMPVELLCRIVEFIGSHPRDVAAAYIASPSLFPADVAPIAVRWGAVHTYRLVKAGAPLDIVRAAIRERGDPIYRRLIKAAASGGRLDVLRHLLGCPGVLRCNHVYDDGAKDKGKVPASLKTRDTAACALRAAVKRGHTEIVRYIVTHALLGTKSHKLVKTDADFVGLAASRGHLAVLQMLHDRAPCSARRLPCTTARMGARAWESDDERVPRWLVEYGCSGYREPNLDDIAAMIRDGRAAMLRYALPRYAKTVGADVALAPRGSQQIANAVYSAARESRFEVLAVVMESDLYVRFDEVLTSAFDEGELGVVRWVGSLEGKRRASIDGVRTAIVWSAFCGSAAGIDAMRWLVERVGSRDAIVDAGLVYAAFRAGGPRAARALLPMMSPDRARSVCWESLMGHAISSGVAAVRYLVEERRVPVRPHHLLDSALPSKEVLDYVLARCSIRTLQDAVDMRGARLTPDDARFVRHVRAHHPSVCASVAVAVSAVAVSPYCLKDDMSTERIDACDCASCCARAGKKSATLSCPAESPSLGTASVESEPTGNDQD